MQGFIAYVLILSFISPYICLTLEYVSENNTYNVMQYGAIGDGKSDDTQAFSSAWSSACNAEGMSTLVIPSKKSFLVTKVNFSGPCDAKILFQFEGKIVAPGKEEWKAESHWITVGYLNGITIDGNGLGEIDGNGSTWWDCSNCVRPVVFHFHSCNDLTVSNLMISNSPRAHVSVNQCNGATFSNISIDSPATSPNTDGFDISSSTNISIQDSNIKAGDDCIAINGGSFFVNVTRVTCGPGHGISVGSLGKFNSTERVSDIYVRNCTFMGSTNGARIKTILEVSSVSVNSVTYRGFNGTFVGNVAINLNCSSSGCFNIQLDKNNIVAAKEGGNTFVFCRNAHGTVRDTIPNVYCLSE
ncbi:hypothetical protein RYX36_024769 [Vicia faba]